MTLKKLLLATLLSASAFLACAQLDSDFFKQPDVERPRGYIMAYSGYGIPTSTFVNTAYAGAKLTFGASMAYLPKDSTSRKMYGMAFKVDYNSFGYENYTFGMNNVYRDGTAMAGIFITFPLHQFSFDFRALGGVMYSKSARQTSSYFDTTGNIIYYQSMTSAKATSFAFDLGFGFRYSQRVGGWHEWVLSVYADRIQSDPEYRVIETSPFEQHPTVFSPDFRFWSLTFGIGIQL